MVSLETIRSSEPLYVATCRSLGIICAAMTSWNVFLILRHSSPEMKHYKWILLSQTLLTCVFGVVMGILWIPVPLFPVMAAYVRGPGKYLGDKGSLVIMSIMSGATNAIAINLLVAIILRYTSIEHVRIYDTLVKPKAFIVYGFIMVFIFVENFIINYAAGVPIEVLKPISLNYYPTLEEIFETEVVFGFTPLVNKWIYVYSLVAVVFFLSFGQVSVVLFWKIIRALQMRRFTMSKRKYRFHWMLMIVTSLQFIIPIIFGVIPIFLVTVMVQCGFPNITIISEICLVFGELHTIMFNLTTTLVIRPYRVRTFRVYHTICRIIYRTRTFSVTPHTPQQSTPSHIQVTPAAALRNVPLAAVA